MRALHSDIGFLVIEFTLIFCVSGIMMILRETDFLKTEKIVEKTISPNLKISKLGKEMRLKNLQILKEQDGIVYFKNGTYNSANGKIKYTSKELPKFLSKLNNIHSPQVKI